MASQKPFLFIYHNGPGVMDDRNKKVKRDVRRHVMLDIGRARRKAYRNPQVDVMIRPLVPNTNHTSDGDSKEHRDSRSMPSLFQTQRKAVPPEWPFWDRHPLVVLERQWDMDTFSAYGIAFVIREGRHIVSKNDKPDQGGFWFPFAFRSSAFLYHFREALTSPRMLASITTAVSREFQIVALRRMSGTISCIGKILSGHDLRNVTANNVIRGVLACICYNLVSSDYAQAQLHLEGLEHLVSARGGVMNLQNDRDLGLMIFWVDVTASLLFNSKPRFPLPYLLLPSSIPADPIKALPSSLARLRSSINPASGRHGAHVLLCLGDLTAVAPSVEHRLAAGTEAPWVQEESIGLDLNPIAHRLVGLSPESGTGSHVVAEALRLGQMIWIILVKRICRAYPGSTASYASTLSGLLGGTKPWYKDANILPGYLRLLVLCATGLEHTHKEAQALGLIQRAVRHWRLTSWREVMVHVRQMPWVNAFDVLCLELSGTTDLLDTRDPSKSAQTSRKLLKHLALTIATQACNTYELTIGFWIPTSTWRLRLEAKEPILPKAVDWMHPIRDKFSAYVGSGVLKERKIEDGNFADWKEWIDIEEGEISKWRHFTQVSVYRGIPFLQIKDDVMYGADIMELAGLKMHDLSVQGSFLESTRLVPGRTDGRHDLKTLLEELIEES